MKACDIKKGVAVAVGDTIYLVKDVQVQSPSSRSGNTLYKVQYRNAVTKQKYEQAYKGEESIETVDFIRRAVQFLYKEADSCTFMDLETYEQYTLDNDAIESALPYLVDGVEGLYALIANDAVLGLELPASVELQIIDCSPSIKGASASARTKPATLSTGLVVQVPEYVGANEVIKVNTSTNEFMSRA